MANFWPTFPHEERKNSHLGFLWKFQGVPFVLNTRALQILQKRARAILLKQHTQEKWTQNSTWDGDSFGIVLSLSLFSFLYLRKKREIAREFSFSLSSLFWGGKLFFSPGGGISMQNAHAHWPLVFLSFYLFNKWNSDYLFKLLVRSSSSLCVFNRRLFIFYYARSLFCVSHRKRDPRRVV